MEHKPKEKENKQDNPKIPEIKTKSESTNVKFEELPKKTEFLICGDVNYII